MVLEKFDLLLHVRNNLLCDKSTTQIIADNVIKDVKILLSTIETIGDMESLLVANRTMDDILYLDYQRNIFDTWEDPETSSG